MKAEKKKKDVDLPQMLNRDTYENHLVMIYAQHSHKAPLLILNNRQEGVCVVTISAQLPPTSTSAHVTQ